MSNEVEPKSNVPEFSVSEIAFSLKKTLETTYSHIRIRGEIGRVTIPRSGHLYTNLKDDSATIDAVCWKGSLSKLSIKPEEGLEVICTGRISSYPASSKYQLIIETMELAGEGALLKMLEERKKKLAAEGLFAAERKKKLPFLPTTIGVVTSATGAVIRDILHRLADRFPRDVILWPVMVQGEGSAQTIANAINGFQTIDQHGLPKPDVLIVGRGGGSLEDLMPFNEEVVVRAIANSEIPIISAVGHETDTTLSDYAADLRAPTPTGAAEMAVPRKGDLIATIAEHDSRLISAINRTISENKHKLDAASARLGDPSKLLEIHAQTLDHKIIRLEQALKNPLRDAQQKMERWSEQLTNLAPRLTRDWHKRLEHAGKMLEAYSFENILERGFAVIQDTNGALISEAAQTSAGQPVQIRFKQQQFVEATIGKTATKKPAKKASSKKIDKDQQTLF